MNIARLFAPVAILGALLTGSCGSRQGEKNVEVPELYPDITRHSELLSIRDLGSGAMLVDIVNPWDTSALLGSYLLLSGDARPDSVPPRQRLTEMRVPLERSAVFSAIHAGAVEELGVAARVGAVADAEYLKGAIAAMIANGSIVDLGSSLSPSMELVAKTKPDAFLLYPMQNAGHGVMEHTGIPIIEMADYMESTPLGRAEWIRLLGILYGRGSEADSIFAAVEADYEALVAKTSQIENRPKVLTEMLTSGYWFVPGGRSYMARLIKDAGGEYPWDADKSSGSLQLDFSAVYARAADADIWLVKTYGADISLAALCEAYPLNSQFKAFKRGGVYAADTKVSPLYEEFPFHPERLLKEFAAIFTGDTTNLRYYKHIN